MEEKKSLIKTKKQMYVVIAAFVLVLLLGTTTYAFFNYTRTGSRNTIRTGRIYFNTEQGNTVTLNNLFPISTEEENPTASTPGVGSLAIHVTGDTEYQGGVEYLLTAVNVTGNNANVDLPISIDVTYTATEAEAGEPANTIGTEDNDYFTNRGGSTARYKILSNGSISEGQDLVVGYIAPNTSIDGTLTILAYIDASNIAITDTYPEKTVYTVKTAVYTAAACETATGLAQDAPICASASALEDELNDENTTLTPAQITALENAGLVTEYTDGTTGTWVNDRIVFTTEEWNALQANGVSFQIRAVAQEGTWVPTPATPTPTPTVSPEQGG